MEIQFDLKEYLEKQFNELKSDVKEIKDELKSDIKEIKEDLKEHRKVEDKIKLDVNTLKIRVNILIGICSTVGTGLIVGLVKYIFFT